MSFYESTLSKRSSSGMIASDITIGEFIKPKPPYILLFSAPWSVGREDSVAAFSLDDDRLDI
jgi:hypothetical protein